MMSLDMSKYPDKELLELTGIVGYREFENAPEYAKEGLREKLVALTEMSDEDFVTAARGAIYGSASVSRFRGNWEADHCYATACYHQSELRKIAAGHLEDCRAQTLYSRAYDEVTSQHGMEVRDYPPCECPNVKEK